MSCHIGGGKTQKQASANGGFPQKLELECGAIGFYQPPVPSETLRVGGAYINQTHLIPRVWAGRREAQRAAEGMSRGNSSREGSFKDSTRPVSEKKEYLGKEVLILGEFGYGLGPTFQQRL